MNEEIPVTEARAQFSELINRVAYGKDRITLTRHGKPLVVLLPAEALSADGGSVPEGIVLDLASQHSNQQHDYTIAAQHGSPSPDVNY